MVTIVDSDITSSICFLTGVCSGSICVIVVAAWTYTVHQSFVATISLLAFFIGYLMVGHNISSPNPSVFLLLLVTFYNFPVLRFNYHLKTKQK